MARIRIINGSAFFLVGLALTLGGAAAQTATTGAAGQPLPLLQIAHPKAGAKLRPHRRVAAARSSKHVAATPTWRTRALQTRAWRKRRLAAESHHHVRLARHAIATHHAVAEAQRVASLPPPPAPVTAPAAPVATPAASATLPANVWPTADTTPPGETTFATAGPAQASPPIKTEAVVDTAPNQIVPNGQPVQTAVPSAVKPASTPAAQATTPAPKASAPAKAVIAAATPPSHPATTTVHAMVVKPSEVGSTSWIMHVLAALGGAISAGLIAWFLIRPAPERRYS